MRVNLVALLEIRYLVCEIWLTIYILSDLFSFLLENPPFALVMILLYYFRHFLVGSVSTIVH